MRNAAEILTELMSSVQPGTARRRAPAAPPCWATQGDEVCENGWHSQGATREQGTARRCPAATIRMRAEALGDLVDRCMPKGEDWRDGKPISPRLRAKLRRCNVWAVERGARIELREVIERAADFGAKLDRHGLWTGHSGLGKTHLQLLVYFGALERGFSAFWMDDPTARRLVTERRSYDIGERERAEQRWRQLLRAQLICWSDMASDKVPPRFDQPGRPLLESAMWELMECGRAKILASSNEPVERLAEHGDVGARVISRLAGAVCGAPALVLHFEGDDQRLVQG